MSPGALSQRPDARYVGSRVGAYHGKWTQVRTTPPKSLVFNRFLDFSNGKIPYLNPVQQGDHVRRHVNAGLSGVTILVESSCAGGGRVIGSPRVNDLSSLGGRSSLCV